MATLTRTRSRESWRCETCQFDNLMLLDLCEMCQSHKPEKYHSKKQSSEIKEETSTSIVSKRKEMLICPNEKCRAENDINEIKCSKCEKFLLEELNDEVQGIDEEEMGEGSAMKSVSKSKGSKPKVELIKCARCSFENDPINFACVSCEHKLKKKRVTKTARPKARGRGPNYCQDCKTYKMMQANGEMQCNCPDPDDGILKTKVCNFCFESLDGSLYDSHIDSCKQRDIFFDRSQNKSFDRCTKLQIDTMYYMQRKCEKLHFGKQKKLQARIVRLGYTVKDLQSLYFYIVNYAPIIIHMHAQNHMQFFVKDTHYRSQFETSKSSGSLSRSSRVSWQNRMFDNMHINAQNFERVKYGTMNFTNDPHGVSQCTSYGSSYFLLKEHVRDRCTMTDMDSSSPSATICTFRFCYHLLCKLSDKEIQAAIEGSKATEVKSAGVIGAYKEIQIHGPVEFAKDIERVYISRVEVAQNPKCLEMVKQFCENNDLQYEEFGEEPPKAVHGGHMGGGSLFGGVSSAFGGSSGVSSFPASGMGVIPAGSAHLSGFGPSTVISHGAFGKSAIFGGGGKKYVPPPKPIKYKKVHFPYSSKPQDDEEDEDQEDDYHYDPQDYI